MQLSQPRRPGSRPWSVVAAGVTVALVLAACGGDDDGSGDATTTATATAGVEPSVAPVTTTAGSTGDSTGSTSDGTDAPAGGGEEVVIGAVLAPTSLDLITQAGAALDQILLDNIYETLLTANEDGGVEAGLTDLPEISEDGLTYTFTIPDGVTFHSGEPLTAADVVWSLDAQRAEGANQVERLASIASVEAPDDQMVELTLSAPDNDLLYTLTRRAGAVLQVDATGLENTANGTGPFRLEDVNAGTSITLSRNDDYWGDAPAVSGVTFLYFVEPNAAVNAFTTGDVDVLTGVNSDLVGPLQDNADYVVNEGSTNGEFTLGFNNGRAPFDDPAVRKAVRQAIDKEGVLELYNGFGTIIGGPVPPADPWYEDLTDVAPYDPEAASAAIEAAGLAGSFVTLVYPNIYPINAAEYVASQLSEVGLEVTIETVEFSVWLDQVFTNKDYDMTVVLHVEPRDIGNYANPDYYWQYDSPEVQQLVADAKTSLDPDEATELLKETARLISEDSPVDWLLLYSDLTVSTPDVTGYPTDDTASRFDASTITIGA
ncbi:MAG: ABC transporter substrate-binding protein [Ilumatobacteraceae bacterium]